MNRMRVLHKAVLCGVAGAFLLGTAFPAVAEVSGYANSNFVSAPTNLTSSATPEVMINASNDHQLFFKAYNDYSDLDNDGTPEITYKHSVDYYGYFDSYKCYEYSSANGRFEPKAVTTDKYCTGGNDAYWSGNFLNWATMTRIDTIRKLLFGGHRRVDTSITTVLERAYLPPDIHSFAKHYAGSDVAKLTPYTPNTTTPTGTSVSNVTIGTGSKSFTTQSGAWIQVGDYLTILHDATHYMQGYVTSFNSGTGALTVNVATVAGNGSTYNSWDITNHTRVGITICNTTYHVPAGGPAANDMSQNVTDPPLIRVAAGNYAFWAAGEVNQCVWEGEDGNNVHPGGNGANWNNPASSGVYASYDRPYKALVGGAPYGDFIARVQACVPGLLGEEKCKQYPYGNYKPIGLLQVYGDTNQLYFGMVAGTYGKSRSGGDIVQKIFDQGASAYSGMCREINLGVDCDGDGAVDDDLVDANHHTGDGTFNKVYQSAGGPEINATKSIGIVNSWSLYRIYGYKYGDWNYNSNSPGDKCPLSVNFFGDASSGECTNWGNPFSEIFLSSLRYYGGENSPVSYQSGDGSYIDGIKYATGVWVDPLNTSNYCARLNIINFNSSIPSADTVYSFEGGDELDTASFGIVKDLGSTKTSKQWTDIIGQNEGIHGNSWFVGEAGVGGDRRCTAKTVASLGDVRGVCPEGPDQEGGFRVAGLAYFAHINDIRSSSAGHPLTGTQKVDTYAVRLASGSPAIEIPVPGSATQKVTLIPACIDNDKGNYGCTLADFKVVTPHQEKPGFPGIYIGKFLAIWEDSLQGNDYDLDAGGIYEYEITSATIKVTTRIALANLGYSIGHGYVISGTTKDGLHIHSGTNNFLYDDPVAGLTDCAAGNCNTGDAATNNTYNIAAAGAASGLLEDPLWYAAKWGGFLDSNGNNLPDLQSEWDKEDNNTGTKTPDGIPDNYFFASNPLQLEAALNRVFLNILRRVSSGTAAAVVSNNVSGEGALYQAYYEPLRQDENGNSVTWIGTVQSLWLDSYGYLREDSGVKGTLENYDTDKVIQFFYDEVENKTRVRRYTGTSPDAFTPQYMQGTVTAYDAATDTVTIDVSDVSGTIGDGPYNDWAVYNLTNSRSGTSTTSSVLAGSGAKTFTVSPDTDWISVGNTVMVAHFDSTVVELEDLQTIWNARQQLNFTAAADLALQRAYGTSADAGRHIKTWIDSDLDSIVDSGEYVDFVRTEALISSKYGFFDVATAATAQNVVDYIRGKEIAGYRPRKIDYDGSGEKIQRLGDIINSTPTVVPAPQEGFDLLYRDSSYSVFKKQYASRRNVLYVGANDGMLHAFNAGFYNRTARKFDTNGLKHDGTAAVAHPLGSELWSYVPMNLLPHLKWLTSAGYEHVSYLDGKPRVFDAKIFTKDADHPGLASDTKGWGTVLVVGMRLGGGPMTIDTATNGLGNPNAADDRTMRSAYVIMDITNPEAAPRLLAEIQLPDGSFTFTYPAVMTFKDNVAASDENKWYLVFGSGPQYAPVPNFTEAKSTTTAKLYALDMAELTTPGTTAAAPVGCSVAALTGAAPTIKVISCDTAIANTFVGSPVVVDWDLDYKADTAYFGLVGDANANTGRLMKMVVNEKGDPAEWKHTVSGTDKALSTLINTSQPVSVIPTPGMDNLGNKWVFFGTGRLYVQADKSSTTTQSLYGIKDSGVEVARNTTDLVNATNIDVYTNGSIDDGPTVAIDTLSELIAEVDTNKKGWYLDLPPIVGTAGSVPATRNLSESALVGGVLFSSVYQPSTDACTGEGLSRLYGLYYKTGTAYDSPTVFGVEEVAGLERSKPYIDLGRGFATSPAIHSGSGTGDKEVSVFTQLSTGTIIRSEAGTVSSVRSGFRSWREAY